MREIIVSMFYLVTISGALLTSGYSVIWILTCVIGTCIELEKIHIPNFNWVIISKSYTHYHSYMKEMYTTLFHRVKNNYNSYLDQLRSMLISRRIDKDYVDREIIIVQMNNDIPYPNHIPCEIHMEWNRDKDPEMESLYNDLYHIINGISEYKFHIITTNNMKWVIEWSSCEYREPIRELVYKFQYIPKLELHEILV